MPNRKRKRTVLERHGHRCVYCGELHDAADLTVDHVQPRVKGGDHSKGNLVACCRRCNVEKGGQPAWAFLADRPALRANFLRYARWVWPRLRTAVEEAASSVPEAGRS
ncbi:MAG: HNH endonuclease signature motif containing protein [Gemmatimonadota bacterium]